ncbi:TetR family transcriptional regulator [Sphingomonas sp. AOB5]|uniref:TetR/AcrR family transcriptional regulator n=1 Tax=Sphingomonas sp. AOB5 TaxID=3034017 RepID=UPI0023F99963|nr:TetR/AcrR family transcriptional regulator [Sphingomonas sp. AOB5]MDF7777809.1 TetR family transcriptional regulator [Sphingomonas sp. AOB5]
MLPPVPCAPRTRNAAATREAILASACRHFARESYENVGVRDIARDAGVDPALVSRYFGSKEQLFKQALGCGEEGGFEDIAREDLPAQLASWMLDEDDECGTLETRVDWMMIMLRSAGSPATAELVRESLQENLLEPLGKAIGGTDEDDCRIRASMAFAIMMGGDVLGTIYSGHSPKPPEVKEKVRARLTALFHTALFGE